MSRYTSQTAPAPLVLAGPILRRTLHTEVNLWLVTSVAVAPHLTLFEDANGQTLLDHTATAGNSLQIECHVASPKCFIYNLRAEYPDGLPQDQWLYYDLELCVRDPDHPEYGSSYSLPEWSEGRLTYLNHTLPGFVIKTHQNQVLHGSCRKPHHFSQDGLVRADTHCETLLQQSPDDVEKFPGLLVLSGDQIYADDVAGPMLNAIHQLIHWLDFPPEMLGMSGIETSEQLYGDHTLIYARDKLLPNQKAKTDAYDTIFGGARKPIFTSVHAKNHLMTLAEVIAMYLLVWSPQCWRTLSLKTPTCLTEKQSAAFEKEAQALKQFVSGLGAVNRVLAHIPTAMIFDDHDVTDDWNLTAAWERAAYGTPFSKRIIGNALLGYLLCQSWGNAPEQFACLSIHASAALVDPGGKRHEHLIDTLIHFPHWGYSWATKPLLKVLDTRTQRWRSERSPAQPSGLLDWESLSHLQQSLINEPSVLLVAPAPVFGVKLIEAIQKIMTWLGQPLMVDAENWMAHSGTANTLLHMFCHAQTPKHFVILSGDVHYSFAYRVRIRGEKSSPYIWQITSSGLRNNFPEKLLALLDRLNRWLYAPRSPLNWFTKRRRMHVKPYYPVPRAQGQRLVNRAGIGLVSLDDQGKPRQISQLCGQADEIQFSTTRNIAAHSNNRPTQKASPTKIRSLDNHTLANSALINSTETKNATASESATSDNKPVSNNKQPTDKGTNANKHHALDAEATDQSET